MDAAEAELGGRGSLRQTRGAKTHSATAVSAHASDPDVTRTRMCGAVQASKESESYLTSMNIRCRLRRHSKCMRAKRAEKRGRRAPGSVWYLWATESRICAQRSDERRATPARLRGELSCKRCSPAAAPACAGARVGTSCARELELHSGSTQMPILGNSGRWRQPL